MTIAFHGFIKKIETAPFGKLAVTMTLPVDEADGAELTIFVPEVQAAAWLPMREVQFTIYPLIPTGDKHV